LKKKQKQFQIASLFPLLALFASLRSFMYIPVYQSINQSIDLVLGFASQRRHESVFGSIAVAPSVLGAALAVVLRLVIAFETYFTWVGVGVDEEI
jgi:hypothetical protein